MLDLADSEQVPEQLLPEGSRAGIDNLAAAYTCGGLVEAGSETTATTLNNWLLAMALNPAVVQRAQQELDQVVGRDRLPGWEDEPNLPYVRAIIKEALRWRPVNKFGMMHATSDDDWYDGYFTLNGSVVILNWWTDELTTKLGNVEDEASHLPTPLPPGFGMIGKTPRSIT
ncbi:cytochrome P450 [Aspergillus tubingensis]|uniref:cytochrome P450 n=1 Tax=Aspergillus tubingensis TaxID=5068 RepID=UPI00157958BC|nr:cytochrome P450 [Aspergillus tubingensis]GFN18415.1 cytochrome P450 [Aspergillus tubingensis]GLB16228.1 hypothetical protein AtubIFM61612_006072 [Aspergillus tubingensis]